ncbi:MAG: SirB2 family protein [Woeseiaceae bacterium]|nr:SirB2 family protein [Woeseiaceae bacterium]
MYETLKLVHIGTVVLTILGFMLRGYWMLTGSPNLRLRVTRIAPHVIDTVLLASGVALIVVLRLPVLDQKWLLTKFAALVIYIVFGAIALGRGKSMRARTTAFVFSLAVFAYIVGVALNKSTLSWLA